MPSYIEDTSIYVLLCIYTRTKCVHVYMHLIRALLPSSPWRMFEPWVHTFGREMIVLSSNHPLVSGFYKMLATCFKVCKLASYFKVSLHDHHYHHHTSIHLNNLQLPPPPLFMHTHAYFYHHHHPSISTPTLTP